MGGATVGGVLTTLKGSALYVAGAIVLAIIGAATYLAASNTLTGSDWLTIVVPVLTWVVGVTTAHVTGQQVTAALVTPPPVTAVPTAGLAPPEAGADPATAMPAI